MATVFVSYSRRDITFAKRLTAELQKSELDFWIDWEDIPPTVDWWKEIESGIEEADVFLFLISPDSAGSKVCKQEIEHAAKNGKRLIPIVVRDIKADESPVELRPLNWIFLRASDDFNVGFVGLLTAIKTDHEWVQAHRQLQVKAREWEKNDHENGFLLHGEELRDAEIQLVANSSKEPHPTELQRQYVLKSRQVTDRQRRLTTSVAIAGLIIVATLAMYGFVQAGRANQQANVALTAQAQAEERAKIARANELAAQAKALIGTHISLALLLSVEAASREDTVQTRDGLLTALTTYPKIKRFLSYPDNGFALATKISADDKYLAARDRNTVVVWNMESGEIVDHFRTDFDTISAMSFSEDGSRIAVSACFDSGTCEIDVWETGTGQRVNRLMVLGILFKRDVALNRDGSIVAIPSCSEYQENIKSCAEGQLSLFDVKTGRLVGSPLRIGQNTPYYLAFVPGKNAIFLIGCKGDQKCDQQEAIYINIDTRTQIVKPLPSEYAGTYPGDISPQGIILFKRQREETTSATSGGNKYWELVAWDVLSEKEKITYSITGEDENAIYFMTINRNGDTVAIASQASASATILRVNNPKQSIIISLTTHPDLVTSFEFDPSGDLFAASRTGEARSDFDPATLLIGSVDSNVLEQPLPEYGKQVLTTAYNPNGKTFVTSICTLWQSREECKKGGMVFWDAHSLTPTKEVDNLVPIVLLRYSQTGNLLVSVDINGFPTVWNEVKHSPMKTAEQSVSDFIDLAISPDEKLLVFSSQDADLLGPVRVLDVEHLRPMDPTFHLFGALKDYSKPMMSISFNPQGDRIALVSGWPGSDAANTIVISDFDKKKTIAELNQHESAVIVVFSPYDQLMVTGGDGTLMFWDSKSLEPKGTLFRAIDLTPDQLFIPTITGLRFSSDGRYLFVESANSEDWRNPIIGGPGKVTLIDIKTRQRVGLSIPIFKVGMSISPDGTRLLTPGYITNMDPQSWIKLACKIAGRNFTRAEWTLYFPDEAYRKTCEEWPIETASPTPTSETIKSTPTISVIPTFEPHFEQRININTASLEELETLPGIGSSLAEKIIQYREQNGPFIQKEDLINVAGIGPGLYDRIQDLITVGQ